MGIGPCEQTTGPSRVENITKLNEDGMESPSGGVELRCHDAQNITIMRHGLSGYPRWMMRDRLSEHAK